MSYATGQTIAAADYNGLAQTTVSGNVNFVLGTGSAQYGYGQTTTGIATVSSTATVSATQWNGLIYLINRALGHQSGAAAQLASGSNIGIVAGATIAAFANVSTAAGTIYTNAGLFNAQGTTVTGTNFVNYANAAAAAAFTGYVATRTVTFASGDAARYFFNAGGQINLVLSTTQPVASARTADVAGLIGTNIGGFSAFRNTTGGGRTGTGATVNTNSTTIGYRQQTTAYQTLVQVTSTTASYTTDVANIVVKSNGVQGTNQDLGSVITFTIGLSAPAHSAFNGTLNVGVNNRIDIIPPETTYLNNSWGSITVA